MACDICGGSGRIEMRVLCDSSFPTEPSMVERSRRYPCPECRSARMVDPKRVTAIKVNEMVLTKHLKDPAVVANRKLRLSRLAAKILVQRGLVVITQRQADANTSVIEMSLGVIRPRGVSAPPEIQVVEDKNVEPLPEEFRAPKPVIKPGVRHLILD